MKTLTTILGLVLASSTVFAGTVSPKIDGIYGSVGMFHISRSNSHIYHPPGANPALEAYIEKKLEFKLSEGFASEMIYSLNKKGFAVDGKLLQANPTRFGLILKGECQNLQEVESGKWYIMNDLALTQCTHSIKITDMKTEKLVYSDVVATPDMLDQNRKQIEDIILNQINSISIQ